MRQGAANFASKNKLVVGATRSQAMTMNPMSKPVRPGTEFLLDDSYKKSFQLLVRIHINGAEIEQ